MQERHDGCHGDAIDEGISLCATAPTLQRTVLAISMNADQQRCDDQAHLHKKYIAPPVGEGFATSFGDRTTATAQRVATS